MAEIPTGTLTFLFTDIEGSTARWEHHRTAMAAALRRHDVLVRGAIERHAGHVFHTAGDAFCAAFANADDALAAALAAQRAIAAEDWAAFHPDFAALRVRMALHTGLAELRDGDYFGPPVNRVARLMAAGHGGQILLSLATQQLLRDRTPDGVALRDLGVHRLKDLRHSEHIFQVLAPDLPVIDAPPATAEKLDTPGRPIADVDLLPAECPYRGLLAFREDDARFFFGRETFTARLERDIAGRPMVGVIGPSGSGKSSVVFAGLLPRLRGNGAADGGAPKPGAEWSIATFRPGADPFAALAGVLVPRLAAELGETDRLVEIAKLAQALRVGTLSVPNVVHRIHEKTGALPRLLLVADQFEELYTLCRDEQDQRRFQDLLFEAVADGSGHHGHGDPVVKLALTLRADFMGHAMAYRPFSDALQDNNILLGPMNRDELSRAITAPAELQGRAFESGLVERILADVGEEAGQLPLLEFALTKLWERQQSGWLTHESYEAIGRVEGAVARHADAVYDGLAPTEHESCRRVFVQMVRPGEGTEDTRRLATIEELGEDWPLVRRLADARLVVTNRDVASGRETVEVVHEALIRSWGRLKGWMNADRAFRTWQERVRFAVRQWDATDHDDGALLRGVPLAEAEGWLAERGSEMAPGERAFVEASVGQRERQAAAERERAGREQGLERRSHRLVRVVAAVAVVGAIVAGALAVSARRSDDRSQRLRMVAQAQKLLAQGLSDPALAVAAEALEGAGDLPEAELALSEAAYSPGAQWVTEGPDKFGALAVSPDGAMLLTGDEGDKVRLWDAANGKALKVLEGHTGNVTSVAWLRDGKRAASGSDDHTVILWEIASGKAVRTIKGSTGSVKTIAVSPDGRQLLTGTDDGVVRLFDLDDDKDGGQVLHRHPSSVSGVAFTPDGRMAVTSSRLGTDIIVWDLAAGHELRRLRGQPGNFQIAVSSDGHQVAGANNNYRVSPVVIWDLDSGKLLRSVVGTQTLGGGARAVAYSSDGRRLAHAYSFIALVNPDTGRELARLNGNTGSIVGLGFSPDGGKLYSVASDKTLRSWYVQGAAERRRTLETTDPERYTTDVALSPNGQRVFTGYTDATAHLYDVHSGEVLLDLRDHTRFVWGVAYSPDGKYLATGAGSPLTVRVWDAATGELRWRGDEHPGGQGNNASFDVTFSPDASVVASTAGDSGDGTVQLWATATGEHLGQLGLNGYGKSLAFSQDGRRLVVAVTTASSGEVQVWNVVEGRLEKRLRTDSQSNVNSVDISRDGRMAASLGADRILRIWDLEIGRERFRAAVPGTQAVVFSPDGATVALSLRDGVGILDIARRAFVRKYPISTDGTLRKLDFSPDGRTLAMAQDRSAISYVWQVHSSLPELNAWVRSNRFLYPLSCGERSEYATRQQCGPGGTPPPTLSPPTARDLPTAIVAKWVPVADDQTLAAQWRARLAAQVVPTTAVTPVTQINIQHEWSSSVSISTDGRYFVTSAGTGDPTTEHQSNDNSAALWDARTGALLRRFNGHSRMVEGTDLSPDGRRLVTCGDDKRLILWDVATGKALWHHDTRSAYAYRCRFDPAGKRIAYGDSGSGAQAVVLDADTAQELVQLGPHDGTIQDLAFSPDGLMLLTASFDGEVRLWDIAAGKLSATFGDDLTGHTSGVYSVQFDRSGKRAVSAGLDGTVIVWDVATGGVLHRLEGHNALVTRARFTPDGRRVVSIGDDRTMRVWDAESGKVIRAWQAPASWDLAIAPDGRTAVSSGRDGILRVWPLDDGSTPPTLASTTNPAPLSLVPPLLPAPGAPKAAGIARAGMQRGTLDAGGVDRWRLADLADQVVDIRIRADRPVTDTLDAEAQTAPGRLDLRATARDADGHTLAEADDEPGGLSDAVFESLILPAGAAATLDVGATAVGASGSYSLTVSARPLLRPARTIGTPRFRPEDAMTLRAVALTPDGRQALAGGGDFDLWGDLPRAELPIGLWDLASGSLVRQLNQPKSGHTETVMAFAIHPDGHRALVGSNDGHLVLWDLDSGREMRRFTGHNGSVRAVAFSPDGRQAVSGGVDHRWIVWDIASGKEIKRFNTVTDDILAVAFQPDGQAVVAATAAGNILVWQFAGDEDPRTLSGAGVALNALALDAPGQRAVSGSADGTVSLWDLDAGTVVQRMQRPLAIESVALSPDGRFAASGSRDATISLWRLDTGVEVARLMGHLDTVRGLVFTPDGGQLVSASDDGSLRVWDVAGVVSGGQ